MEIEFKFSCRIFVICVKNKIEMYVEMFQNVMEIIANLYHPDERIRNLFKPFKQIVIVVSVPKSKRKSISKILKKKLIKQKCGKILLSKYINYWLNLHIEE